MVLSFTATILAYSVYYVHRVAVLFLSLDKVNGDGDDAERGRTRTISGTRQPVWRNPRETFILTAVEELLLEVTRTRVCVREKVRM